MSRWLNTLTSALDKLDTNFKETLDESQGNQEDLSTVIDKRMKVSTPYENIEMHGSRLFPDVCSVHRKPKCYMCTFPYAEAVEDRSREGGCNVRECPQS